jgi:Pyrimidine dimer DNA glycosylase
MRMWMVNPNFMCRQHLLGEHLEVHMFLSSVKERKKLTGFVKNNLFEPMSIFQRHEDLKAEMKRRGYNHNSPMNEAECGAVFDIPFEERTHLIDRESALRTLIERCPKCRSKYHELLNIDFLKIFSLSGQSDRENSISI